MDNLRFISSSSLIALVQEDMASFDANNQLDPGRWYPMIQKVVSDLGIACYEYKHELVYIKNYRGKLEHPGFYIMDSAFWVREECRGGTTPLEGPIHYQGRNIIWDDTTSSCAHQVPDCAGSPDCNFRTCSIDSFNEITVREYVRGLPYTYNIPILHPLSINQRVAKGWCLPHSICFGSHSKEEITINKGEVFTNFEHGVILVNYYTFPYGPDGLPEIPDHPKFKLALEHYLKWKTLENLWLNNDDLGVENKMMYFKHEFEDKSYADAEYFVKLTDYDGLIDIARNNRKRYNCMQLLQK